MAAKLNKKTIKKFEFAQNRMTPEEWTRLLDYLTRKSKELDQIEFERFAARLRSEIRRVLRERGNFDFY
jgi:hypothetical protein